MQRKLTYFAVIVGFLSMCIFFACRKDNHISNQDKPDPNAAMNVDLAQSYYYNSLMKKPGTTTQTNLSVTSTGSNAVSGEKNYKYLMFGLSHNSQTEKVTYIEIPLRYNRRPSSVIATDEQTGDYAEKLKILNASFDRLLIYKDKATNEIDQAVVTYIPDAEYLKKHNNDISGNHIDKLDADFNGYLEYRKWDGSIMFLLKIANGKIIRDYIYKTASANGTNNVQVNSTIKVNAMVCTPMYTQHWVQQCYSSDPEGSNMVCGQWVLEGTDYWSDCHDDGSGNGPPLTGDPCRDYGYCYTPTPPPSSPPPPSNSINKLLKPGNTLTQAQKDYLQNVLNKITSNCIGQATYNYFSQHAITFGFIDYANAFAPASYNPSTGNITIRDFPTLTSVALEEEFFHAYQNITIPGGTGQYTTSGGHLGSANIEFESKVIRDVSTYMDMVNGNGNGSGLSLADPNYLPFLQSITNNFTSYPKSFTPTQSSQYFNFLPTFIQQNPGYSNTTIDNSLFPQSMFNLVNSSTCSH